SYPICSFEFAFVLQNWAQAYSSQVATDQMRELVDYLLVAVRPQTQRSLSLAGYAPLPENFRQIAEDGIRSISYFDYTTLPI
ncbi:MAG: hypothetical protein ABR548_12100, partial [Actinomycetota bacterium]|nr:hypothetical protein [Actinomycetota bacterium]